MCCPNFGGLVIHGVCKPKELQWIARNEKAVECFIISFDQDISFDREGSLRSSRTVFTGALGIPPRNQFFHKLVSVP